MKSVFLSLKQLILVLALLGLVACSDETKLSNSSAVPASTNPASSIPASSALTGLNPAVPIQANQAITLDVYKSPSCGCCTGWIEHIEHAGFDAVAHHPADLQQLKTDKAILPRYQSCHTAISSQGYVFEGHIPAHYIQQFLDNPPPGSLGLAVPAMPVGSPGMEMGDKFAPYQVLLLKPDGSSEVYAEVKTAQEQYR